MVSGIGVSSQSAANAAASASSNVRFQQAVASQQANRVSTARVTATAATNEAIELSSAPFNTARGITQPQDGIVGTATYNAQGVVRPVHSGSGQIFSASA